MNLAVLDGRQRLDVFDRVAVLARPGKEVALVAAVTGETTDKCARLPVGERDRLLMALYTQLFSDRYECEVRCTECQSLMGFSFSESDLGINAPAVDVDSLMLTEGRVVIRLRLPHSSDIAACLDAPNPAAALFTKCVKVQSSPAHKIGQIRTDNLPASLRQSAIERLAALDPYADLMFELECPSCGHTEKVMFDPVIALLVRARQDASFTRKATLHDVQGGPGSSGADFLERLIRRHTYDATVHPLKAG